MNFDDDLPLFFNDFGKLATWNGQQIKVLFDKPYLEQFSIASSNPFIRAPLASFAEAIKGQLIIIEGITYKIQSIEPNTSTGIVIIQLGKN